MFKRMVTLFWPDPGGLEAPSDGCCCCVVIGVAFPSEPGSSSPFDVN